MTTYELINYQAFLAALEYQLQGVDKWYLSRFRDFYLGPDADPNRPTETQAMRNIYYEGLIYAA